MKTYILTLLLMFSAGITFANDYHSSSSQKNLMSDTIRFKVDTNRNIYYQGAVKLSKNLTVDVIYTRIVQLMAAKNIQQNFGYQQDGKLIFTTSQDLNINPNYVGDDNDNVIPYTVQFAIIIDLKPGSYRYTINNIVLYFPTQTGNKREPYFDLYLKATDTNSKRVARNAQNIMNALEHYLAAFSSDLRQGVEQTSPMYSKF